MFCMLIHGCDATYVDIQYNHSKFLTFIRQNQFNSLVYRQGRPYFRKKTTKRLYKIYKKTYNNQKQKGYIIC